MFYFEESLCYNNYVSRKFYGVVKMSYSVNPNLFRSIFAVPTEIVDKHIRLAGEQQLKVLLWILKNAPENPDINQMCKALKINPDDVDDYLQYWVLTGVLHTDGKQVVVSSPAVTQTTSEPAPEPVKVAESKTRPSVEHIPSKPTSSEIAIRIEESPEIGHLFNEAQLKLGKTIGYDGQCALLLIHDHYGLPAEVIFMLIDYCVSVGKTNYNYILTVGKDWGQREIDTLEKAAEQITTLKNINSLWNVFARNVGISNPRPTVNQLNYFRKWSTDWKFTSEMIILAYEEMVEHTGKIRYSYMDKILENWHKIGCNTPDIVKNLKSEKAALKSASKKPVSNNQTTTTPSYDLDEFEERSIYGNLIYKKKEDKK